MRIARIRTAPAGSAALTALCFLAFAAPDARGQLIGKNELAEFVYPYTAPAEAHAPATPELPDEPSLSPAQDRWIRAWQAKVYRIGMGWDAHGRVTRLRFSNHGIYRGDQPLKPALDDDDMQGLLEFPHLRDVGWEKQRVGNKGVAVLAGLPRLEEVRFHYMAGALRDANQPGRIDPNFMLVVDGRDKLRVLELKHLFALNGTSVHKFRHRFDAMEFMELDCESAGPEALHLLSLTPNLLGLELHRTVMTDADLARLVERTPKLVYLEIKPRGGAGGITGRSLRHVRKLKQIRVLRLSHAGWKPLGYADGLEHLVDVPSLKVLMLPRGIVPEADIARLREARPDLEIR